MGIFNKIRETKEKFRDMQYSNKYRAAINQNKSLEADRQRMAKLEDINKQNKEAQIAIDRYKKEQRPSMASRFVKGVQALQKKKQQTIAKVGKKKTTSSPFQSREGVFSGKNSAFGFGNAKPGFFELGNKKKKE